MVRIAFAMLPPCLPEEGISFRLPTAFLWCETHRIIKECQHLLKGKNVGVFLWVGLLRSAAYDAPGRAAIFDCGSDGSLTLTALVKTGVQPDMITYTPNGSRLLTADEGEPRNGYDNGSTDPMGTVTVIDTAKGTAQTVDFTAYDSTEARQALAEKGIVLKKDTLPSVDLEPEYVAVDNETAYVTLQEANAIGILDLNRGVFTDICSAGFEDYSKVAIDIDKSDEAYAPKTYENLRGIRMPDGISLKKINGKTYLLIANEGDARDYAGHGNETKAKTSPTGKISLGSKVTWFDASGYDGLAAGIDYLFGGRSFTLFRVDEKGLAKVFDSGSDFEALTANYLPKYFNCSNDDLGLEDRSGKKGPEPETVVTGVVGDRTYTFVTLERIGGVMVYDITDPEESIYVNYINSRDFSTTLGADDSPEGLKFVPAASGPTGKAMLLAACEVGGTVAAYELTPKAAPAVENPFADITADDYYYDAVLWAAAKGITKGTAETAFSPLAPCTRGQVVTFLYRDFQGE